MVLKELFAALGLDLDAQSFAKGQLAVEGVKLALGALKGVALSVASAIPRMTQEVISTADKVDETSQAIGISTDALQELAYAAGFSGLNLDGLAGSMTILSRNMAAARDGSEEVQKAFRAAGVAYKDAEGNLRPTEDVLLDLADHFSAMEDGTAKTALSMKLFGKSGASLIPFLNAGSAGIGELRAEAQKLGIVLDETAVAAGAEADDAITKLNASLTGLKNAVIGPLLPMVTEMAQGFAAWVQQNRELLKSGIRNFFLTLRAAARALLLVMRAVGAVFRFVHNNAKLLAAILGSVLITYLIANATAFSILGTAALLAAKMAVAASWQMVKAGVRAAISWAIAAAPFVAIAGAVLLVILILEDLYQALTGGDSLIGRLFAKWKEFADGFLEPAEGDPWWVKLLKGFIWTITHLGEVWDETISYFKDVITGFIDWIVNAFKRIGTGIKDGVQDGADALVRSLPGGDSIADAVGLKHSSENGLKAYSSRAALVAAAGEGAPGKVAARAASAPGSKVDVGGVSIAVTAAPGQDPEAVGRVVKRIFSDEMAALLGGTPSPAGAR